MGIVTLNMNCMSSIMLGANNYAPGKKRHYFASTLFKKYNFAERNKGVTFHQI